MKTINPTSTSQIYHVLEQPQNKARLKRQGLRELIREIDTQYDDPQQAYPLIQALSAQAKQTKMSTDGAEYDLALLIEEEAQAAEYQLYNRVH
jgi:hypothetical protein